MADVKSMDANLPNCAQSTHTKTGEKAAGEQISIRLSASAKIAAQNTPERSSENGVLATEDFAEHARGQRASPATELEDRGEPSRCAR